MRLSIPSSSRSTSPSVVIMRRSTTWLFCSGVAQVGQICAAQFSPQTEGQRCEQARTLRHGSSQGSLEQGYRTNGTRESQSLSASQPAREATYHRAGVLAGADMLASPRARVRARATTRTTALRDRRRRSARANERSETLRTRLVSTPPVLAATVTRCLTRAAVALLQVRLAVAETGVGARKDLLAAVAAVVDDRRRLGVEARGPTRSASLLACAVLTAEREPAGSARRGGQTEKSASPKRRWRRVEAGAVLTACRRSRRH